MGGWGTCRFQFSGKDDVAYRVLLKAISREKERLDNVPRFGSPEFKPNRQYVREMIKFGILSPDFDFNKDSIDVFETDQRYWELFWYRPDSKNKWAYIE